MVPKIDWGLDLGPMQIWCEYEHKSVENSGLQSSQRKTHLAPYWPQMELQRAQNRWAFGPWYNRHVT